ncbi:MAG: MarR family winged helix-turn-helix transcriptional regulator [Ilumatobacteraceae bacterium]
MAVSAAPDDLVGRMAAAWRELRRGPAAAIVRDRLFGTGDDAVEPAQVDVLDLLVRRDGWRMNELASALLVDPSTITRTVQRMEVAGLALRSPHDHDGRVVTVHLTDVGRRCQRTVAERRREVVGQLLARFDADDARRLVELAERFVDETYDYVGLSSALGSPAAAAG